MHHSRLMIIQPSIKLSNRGTRKKAVVSAVLSGVNPNPFHSALRQRTLQPRASSIAQEPRGRSLAAARGRDNPVHSEVFDQLTVMIERVSSGECCHEQASGRSATARANRLDKIRRV